MDQQEILKASRNYRLSEEFAKLEMALSCFIIHTKIN
jgi:hypothetical protein